MKQAAMEGRWILHLRGMAELGKFDQSSLRNRRSRSAAQGRILPKASLDLGARPPCARRRPVGSADDEGGRGSHPP